MRIEDHVVDPPVAVHQRHAPVVGRDPLAKPVDQPLHVLQPGRLARPILLAPALQLADEIASGLPEVGKAGRI